MNHQYHIAVWEFIVHKRLIFTPNKVIFNMLGMYESFCTENEKTNLGEVILKIHFF